MHLFLGQRKYFRKRNMWAYMCHKNEEKTISWRKRKKMTKMVHELCSEGNKPTTMHCFSVTEGFDTAIEVQFQKKHEFKCHFENYIGIQSFTAKSRKNKKKARRKVCQSKDGCFILPPTRNKSRISIFYQSSEIRETASFLSSIPYINKTSFRPVS